MRARAHALITSLLLVLVSAAQLSLADPASADDAPVASGPSSAAQSISVVRPPGMLAISDLAIDEDGQLLVGVIDTRPDDPGWSVVVSVSGAADEAGWSSRVLQQTEPFDDLEGTVYAQQVVAGRPGSEVLAQAAAGHGLGIARVGADLSELDPGARITVTIV